MASEPISVQEWMDALQRARSMAYDEGLEAGKAALDAERQAHDSTRRRLEEAERLNETYKQMAENIGTLTGEHLERPDSAVAQLVTRLAEAEQAAHTMSANADRHADEYAELEQRLTATQDALRQTKAAVRALIAEMQAHADIYGHDMLFLPTFKALAELSQEATAPRERQ